LNNISLITSSQFFFGRISYFRGSYCSWARHIEMNSSFFRYYRPLWMAPQDGAHVLVVH